MEEKIFANMHNHSTFSDSIYTPEQMASLAKEAGYGAIVLTDHDTIRGTYFMQKAARKLGLLSMLGCEFSTVGFGQSIHLLGFDFTPDVPEMQKLLRHCAQKATLRSKLLFEWGIERGLIGGVTWEEVVAAYPFNDYYCNDQVFCVMRDKGLVDHKDDDFWEAFSFRYPEREAKIREITGLESPKVEDVIRIIRLAGGVPVIAHPHEQFDLIEPLMQVGLLGMEVDYQDAPDEEVKAAHELADKLGIYKTGGSDHGGILSGVAWDPDKPGKDPEERGVGETDFMKIYRRKLG